MNNLDKQYTDLLQDILDNGVTKQDRTGTGTLSVFGRQIRHKMSEGFPLLTTKKMYFKGIVTELLWFLRGDTNIKYLVDNDCHIWDGDAYKKFKNQFDWLGETNHLRPNEFFNDSNEILTKEEFINKIKTDADFAEKWGDLGPIYGKQWRSWKSFEHEYGEDENGDDFIGMWKGKEKIDQIANSIHLLKTDPDSRRNRVNSWNVGELDQMVLPPCHTDFQFYTRELSWDERFNMALRWGYDSFDLDIAMGNSEDALSDYGIPTRAISLMWNQRSVDTFLGLPFNIASYGLLLEIIAKEVNMVPDELIGNLGDTHLYLNHIEQAKEQIGRELTYEERIKLFEEKTNRSMTYVLCVRETLDSSKIPTRTREPYKLPTLVMVTNPELKFDEYVYDNFKLVNYQSHPTIKAPLSN